VSFCSDKSEEAESSSDKGFEIVEDDSKSLFTVGFDQYHKSNDGDFIVYEIVVQWLEANHPVWKIHKRYSDFVKFHD